MKIDGLIFDMDGTMFDTEHEYVAMWKYTADKWKIDIPDELMFKNMGLPSAEVERNFKIHYGEDFDYRSFKSEMQGYLTDKLMSDGVPIKEGLFELLQYCRDKNIPCAVATSTTRKYAEPLLQKTGADKYMTAVVYGDDVKRGKPNPDIFLQAAKLIGVPPENCGGIEDSRNGILSVHAAEMISFLVPDMVELTDDMRAAADYILPSLSDVLKVLKTRNG